MGHGTVSKSELHKILMNYILFYYLKEIEYYTCDFKIMVSKLYYIIKFFTIIIINSFTPSLFSHELDTSH